MITKFQALNLCTHGRIIYDKVYKNADGSPQRWRINGKIQTWKTRPNEFCVPIKHGLRDYLYLTERNCMCFSLYPDLSDK